MQGCERGRRNWLRSECISGIGGCGPCRGGKRTRTARGGGGEPQTRAPDLTGGRAGMRRNAAKRLRAAAGAP